MSIILAHSPLETHDELLRSGGRYATLHRVQAGLTDAA
jgi:hypothetical protein